MPPPDSLPRIDRLLLADLALPDWHPRFGEGRCIVYADVVHHPDGPILFDTGVGTGSELIERLYEPRVWPVAERLAAVGVEAADLVAVVISHLHFDHCGQQLSLGAPVYVQRAEVEVARTPRFTVPAWAEIPEGRLRVLDGDTEIADGVRVLHTPGHTPGHQSLLVEGGGECVLFAGQAAYRGDEWDRGFVAEEDAHDPSWHPVALASLRRQRDLRPNVVHLSHDGDPWLPSRSST